MSFSFDSSEPPMFPPRCAPCLPLRAPPYLSSRPSSSAACSIAEVVLFPALPVTPTILVTPRPTSSQIVSPISVHTGTPAPVAAARNRLSHGFGTAGLAITNSAVAKSSTRCSPNTQVTRPDSISLASCDSGSASFSTRSTSVSVTRAPRATRYLVTPTPPPNCPRPMTVTRLPATSGTSRAIGWCVGRLIASSPHLSRQPSRPPCR